MIATHEGRFDEAEQLAIQARQLGTRFDSGHASGTFSVQMFTIRRQQARLHEVAPVLAQFMQNRALGATWWPGLAILHCELGARDEAREAFEQLAAGGFAGLARDAIWAASIAYLAEVCAWLGDAPRAATLYELLLPYAERNIVFGSHTASFGAAGRVLGLLAATLQRWDAAERHFERAIALDTSSGGKPWLARSRCDFAAMLMQRSRPGDRDRAATLLTAGLDDSRIAADLVWQRPSRGPAGRPDRARGAGASTCRRRQHQPADRRRAVPQRQHHRDPRAQHSRQDPGVEPRRGGGVRGPPWIAA